MKIFVCQICNEVYIGESLPPSCPFCGVNRKYLAFPHVWTDKNNVVLSDKSRKNLLEALKLEESNTAFYSYAANNLKDKVVSNMFKGLYKVEREHASVFRKILKPTEAVTIKETYPEDEKSCIKESRRREESAVAFYNKALSEATEDRVKEVFEAIMNTEKDHLALDDEMLKIFNN